MNYPIGQKEDLEQGDKLRINITSDVHDYKFDLFP